MTQIEDRDNHTTKMVVNVDGSINIQDPTSKYKASDEDSASNPQYFGYVEKDGAWYIMKYDTTTGAMRYNVGASAYGTAWAIRGTASYSRFDEVF